MMLFDEKLQVSQMRAASPYVPHESHRAASRAPLPRRHIAHNGVCVAAILRAMLPLPHILA